MLYTTSELGENAIGISSFQLPSYTPSQTAWKVLVEGNIIETKETPQDFLARVIYTLFSVEKSFGTSQQVINKLSEEFASYMVEGYATPGTPALTNAGRYKSALSSCVVIPVDLTAKSSAARKIKSYFKQNMGSGFDFSCYKNPVELLKWINNLSVKETATHRYDRYIGNMGTLHVSHPKIRQFIDVKRTDISIKHFNISVNVSEKFMKAAMENKDFFLADGSKISARLLVHKIAENAWANGDPGMVFLERLNRDNPVVKISPYVCVPPCSEMGLAEGETCQFGYINLAKFVCIDNRNHIHFDYNKLRLVTQLLTRVLDNTVEYGILYSPHKISRYIAQFKRKIGIGICGLADVLIAYGFPYDSPQSRNLAREILSFINYTSKVYSVKLAIDRGSCLAMKDKTHNSYFSERFLEEKYGKNPTKTVPSSDWEQLANKIRLKGKLRNILTTSLPPTGRSSILLGSTSAIEPIFSIFEQNGNIKKVISSFLSRKIKGKRKLLNRIFNTAQRKGSFQAITILPQEIRNVLKTAKEITPEGHIKMVASLTGINGVVDESASKTVNLSNNVTIKEVEKLFYLAYDLGFKNISVYRDGSKAKQPEKL